MKVDSDTISTRKKTKRKKAAHPGPPPQQSGQRAQGASTSTSTAQGEWTAVVGRKASNSGRVVAPANTTKTDLPPIPPTKPLPRRLPPLRNTALIIKVPTGYSFEDTVRTIHKSGVNSDYFKATVTCIRKTRGGDVVVDLGRGGKSRVTVTPLKNALDIRCLCPGGNIRI